jgi:mannose/fructose-specific phosphotransferase system component IIA
MKTFDEIIVFTDLLGGSPGNAAVLKFISDEKVHVISGMNFPMLLSTVLTEGCSVDEITSFGRNGIQDVKAFVKANMSDDDE